MKIKDEWRRAVGDAVIAAGGSRTPSMYIDIAVETIAPLIAAEAVEACVRLLEQEVGDCSDPTVWVFGPPSLEDHTQAMADTIRREVPKRLFGT